MRVRLTRPWAARLGLAIVRVLVIGSGAREHALLLALRDSISEHFEGQRDRGHGAHQHQRPACPLALIVREAIGK